MIHHNTILVDTSIDSCLTSTHKVGLNAGIEQLKVNLISNEMAQLFGNIKHAFRGQSYKANFGIITGRV